MRRVAYEFAFGSIEVGRAVAFGQFALDAADADGIAHGSVGHLAAAGVGSAGILRAAQFGRRPCGKVFGCALVAVVAIVPHLAVALAGNLVPYAITRACMC